MTIEKRRLAAKAAPVEIRSSRSAPDASNEASAARTLDGGLSRIGLTQCSRHAVSHTANSAVSDAIAVAECAAPAALDGIVGRRQSEAFLEGTILSAIAFV